MQYISSERLKRLTLRLPTAAILALLCAAALLALSGCKSDDDKEQEWTALLSIIGKSHDNQNGTITGPGGKIWTKCLIGQQYNPASNGCDGAGGGTVYNAQSMDLCDQALGCFSPDTLQTIAGPVFRSCDTLEFAGRNNWRVPTRSEWLELLSGYTRDTFVLLFSHTPDDKYAWSATQVETLLDSSKGYAYDMSKEEFARERQVASTGQPHYVRCIAEP